MPRTSVAAQVAETGRWQAGWPRVDAGSSSQRRAGAPRTLRHRETDDAFPSADWVVAAVRLKQDTEQRMQSELAATHQTLIIDPSLSVLDIIGNAATHTQVIKRPTRSLSSLQAHSWPQRNVLAPARARLSYNEAPSVQTTIDPQATQLISPERSTRLCMLEYAQNRGTSLTKDSTEGTLRVPAHAATTRDRMLREVRHMSNIETRVDRSGAISRGFATPIIRDSVEDSEVNAIIQHVKQASSQKLVPRIAPREYTADGRVERSVSREEDNICPWSDDVDAVNDDFSSWLGTAHYTIETNLTMARNVQ